MNRQRAGLPFIALGIAFIVLASGGRRAFYGVGVVFLAIGIVFLTRGRR